MKPEEHDYLAKEFHETYRIFTSSLNEFMRDNFLNNTGFSAIVKVLILKKFVAELECLAVAQYEKNPDQKPLIDLVKSSIESSMKNNSVFIVFNRDE